MARRGRGPTQDDFQSAGAARTEVGTVSSPLPGAATCGCAVTTYDNFTVPLVIAYLAKPAFESQAALNLATVRFVPCGVSGAGRLSRSWIQVVAARLVVERWVSDAWLQTGGVGPLRLDWTLVQ